MTNSTTIALVTVTDNHYVVLLAALLKSIECNLSPTATIDVWVIADGVSKNNKQKLGASFFSSAIYIHWVPAAQVLPKGTKLPTDKTTWPQNIYLRLFIPNILPINVDRYLVMDVDMINCKDITQLWQTGLGGKIIAAVQDPRVPTFANSWGGIANYKELSFDGDTKYFNSGLMLVDAQKWKAENITQKTLDAINNNIKYAQYPDQYGLGQRPLAVQLFGTHFPRVLNC